MQKKIYLRNRGQITLPKKVLQKLDAKEDDSFVLYYDESEPQKITLEFIKTKEIDITDGLDKYIIADLKKQGLSSNEIKEILPRKKEEMEEKYLEYLKELEVKNDFVDFN